MDESTFQREDILNIHNYYVWTNGNQYRMRQRSFERRSVVNIWARVIQYHPVRPYLLPRRLEGDAYLVFLQEVLPELLNHVPASIRRRMWFRRDGTP